MRYKFVKRDPRGNAVLLTQYDASEESSDQVLADLRRLDFEAIKLGWMWEKVPADEVPDLTPITKTKKWVGALMNDEPLPVGGKPSEETYYRRMRENGIERSEAERLRKLVDNL